MRWFAPPSDAPSVPVKQLWRALLQELPGLVSDRVLLLSLELKRASRALGQIVLLLLAVIVLAGVAWLLLCLGVAAMALDAGWSRLAVLLLVLGFNGALAAWALLRARSLVARVALPATLRRLTVQHSHDAPDAPPRPPTAARPNGALAPQAQEVR